MLGKRTQGRDEGDLDRGEELQSVFENERYVGIWGGCYWTIRREHEDHDQESVEDDGKRSDRCCADV